jgi:uncharacterized protein
MKTFVTRRAALLAAPLFLASASSRAAPANWPRSLTIGTAAPGATTLAYGQALAKILTGTLGIAVAAQPTQGADQNIVLLEAGQAMVGLVTMGPASQGWNGAAEWTRGRKYRAMRAIFPMFDTPFHVVALQDSGIQTVADLAGKRVVTGPRGGTGGTYFPVIFTALNIAASMRNGAWTESGAQFENRQLDALAISVGVPFPLLVDLDAKVPLVHVAFTAEQTVLLHQAMPELTPSVVPAGAYRSLKTDYPTVGMYNFAVAHRELPDDLVHAIVKATFENRDGLIAAHPASRETLAANAVKNSFLPFHPGAVRYYREIGIAIPDSLAKGD